uniref:Uncharacterized protein n=1 Tax=Anguilla anguilla TaxID=7936 RepID=A0A0E9WFF5_ANGAN
MSHVPMWMLIKALPATHSQFFRNQPEFFMTAAHWHPSHLLFPLRWLGYLRNRWRRRNVRHYGRLRNVFFTLLS